MKKNCFVICALLITSLTYSQIRKAAVISVFGSRNLSNDILETKIYEALMKDTSFNLTPIVEKFANTINEKFVPQFPFPFLSKEEVVNANGYQDLKALTKWANESWYTTPAKSYVPIAAIGVLYDEKAIMKSFEVLGPEVDAVLITYIDFKIYDQVGSFGISSKKIYAWVNVIMINREGKKIFKLKEGAISSSGVIAIGGFITDLSKLKPMIESASEKLLADMNEKLPKSLAKMAKKLNK